MSKRSWEHFAVGDTVGGAIILEKLNNERLQTELKYFVRWPCCGRTGEQTHSQLAKRHRTERALCWHCARAQRSLAPEKPSLTTEPTAGAITIPRPGIDGIWMFLGKLGPRWHGRGTDHDKSGREA